MVSIKVETVGNDNKPVIDIGMHGKCVDIIHEIAIGALAAVKQATGNTISYSDVIRLAVAAIVELDEEELEVEDLEEE